MRINIIEFNLQRMGGRQSTLIQFADYFKSIGHKVRFIAKWTKDEVSECTAPKNLLKFHGLSHLTIDDFDWNYNSYKKKNTWPDCDLYFLSSPTLTPVSVATKIPNISWKIVTYLKCKNPKTVKEFWTNSRTSYLNLAGEYDIPMQILPPPYSYKRFREAALPYQDRDIDMIDVVRMNAFKEKDIPSFLNIAKKLNLNAMLVVLAHSEEDLIKAKSLPVKVICNQTKAQVASLMGRAKVFFHPSTDESCSIAIYEALNAGCVPVVYDVGAAREQIGDAGFVYKSDPADLVSKALLETNQEQILATGLKFDRLMVGKAIKNRLNKIEESLCG